MASASKTRALNVTCPCCSDEDAVISLNLNDLNECQCSARDETFSAAETAAKFAALAERWGAVAKWIDAAPVV